MSDRSPLTIVDTNQGLAEVVSLELWQFTRRGIAYKRNIVYIKWGAQILFLILHISPIQ